MTIWRAYPPPPASPPEPPHEPGPGRAAKASAPPGPPASPAQLVLPGLELVRIPGQPGLHIVPSRAPAPLVRERVLTPALPSPAGERPPLPEDAPLRELEYVVVDTETTGGSPLRGHRITEFAGVVVTHDGRVVEEFSSLVNPERPIPPFITALTNISWDMVRNAPRFQEIALDVERLLRGRVFVAHNAAFDWRFVSAELARATGSAPEAAVLCTVRMSRKLVPEVASRSLDALSYFFDLHNEARHRAFGDARVTAALLARLLHRLDDFEVGSWAELQAFLKRRKPRKPRRGTAMPAAMDTRDIPAQ